jgi:hypothetical protein
VRSTDLDWLLPHGVHLATDEVVSMLTSLRSLIDGTDADEPNRAQAVTMAYTLAHAIDREDS